MAIGIPHTRQTEGRRGQHSLSAQLDAVCTQLGDISCTVLFPGRTIRESGRLLDRQVLENYLDRPVIVDSLDKQQRKRREFLDAIAAQSAELSAWVDSNALRFNHIMAVAQALRRVQRECASRPLAERIAQLVTLFPDTSAEYDDTFSSAQKVMFVRMLKQSLRAILKNVA